MIKRFFTIVIITILAIFAFSISDSMDAMSWPSENAALIRNFGTNDMGSPVLGMVFAGQTQVLAAEAGEVIFSRNRNDTASRLPSPFGAWTAIDHGDGLITIYSRYDDNGVSSFLEQVERQQPIAVSGTSGWSQQNGFYFLVFDRRERRWINPAMIVTPLQDTRAPQILSVTLRNAQGQVVQSNNLTQGRYTVIVNVAGGTVRPVAGSPVSNTQHAPLRIVCSVNGAEAGTLNFEAVSARDGTLMVYRNGLTPASRVYNPFPAFEAADVFLSRGQVSLEVIVQDITGATHNIVQRLTVN